MVFSAIQISERESNVRKKKALMILFPKLKRLYIFIDLIFNKIVVRDH